MASRTTLREAQELKAKWQAEDPDAKFRIVDNSQIMKVGRLVAEAKGYKIIGAGSIRVLAEVTQFDVLEVRQCHKCGAEILTVAIGEAGLDECRECKAKRQKEYQVELHESERREAQRIASWDARDEWEEG